MDGKKVIDIQGNKCRRGVAYAKHEMLDPRRMLTTSILVKNGIYPLVSVKTSKPLPKPYIFQALQEIKKTTVNAPIEMGETIIKNILGLDVDIVATKTIKKRIK